MFAFGNSYFGAPLWDSAFVGKCVLMAVWGRGLAVRDLASKDQAPFRDPKSTGATRIRIGSTKGRADENFRTCLVWSVLWNILVDSVLSRVFEIVGSPLFKHVAQREGSTLQCDGWCKQLYQRAEHHASRTDWPRGSMESHPEHDRTHAFMSMIMALQRQHNVHGVSKVFFFYILVDFVLPVFNSMNGHFATCHHVLALAFCFFQRMKFTTCHDMQVGQSPDRFSFDTAWGMP